MAAGRIAPPVRSAEASVIAPPWENPMITAWARSKTTVGACRVDRGIECVDRTQEHCRVDRAVVAAFVPASADPHDRERASGTHRKELALGVDVWNQTSQVIFVGPITMHQHE